MCFVTLNFPGLSRAREVLAFARFYAVFEGLSIGVSVGRFFNLLPAVQGSVDVIEGGYFHLAFVVT